MTIAEFVKGRNVDSQAIRKFIERHPEDFKGHTGKKGREITLDAVALDVLEEKYPLQQMVQIIEDTESRTKLIKLQEEYIKLQTKMNEQTMLIAQAEAQKVLLEDKEQQLEEKNLQLEDAKRQLVQSQVELGKFRKSIFGFYKKDE